ncbi:MAG: elongation factor P [Proteobacteria bacterium]|nr:elongation factor P [Pseudomonadota bacterium]
MYSTADFKKGLKIEFNGEPYEIIDFQHVKMGRGGAIVRTKMKNLKTGYVMENTFRSGEKVERPNLEEKEMQFLYKSDNDYVFMDNESYEQINISEGLVGDNKDYLMENMNVRILFFQGNPIGIELPTFVELKVVETVPGIKGDTVSGGGKPAKLETGATIQVPLFINEGDVIKIDTRTGTYIERVNK